MEPRRFNTRVDRPEADTPRGVTGRAMVIEPYLRRAPSPAPDRAAAESDRAPSARLDEAIGLALAIDLDVVESGTVALSARRPATYIGSGKVEELAGVIKSSEIELVVMDCALSPVQQRNLEKAWNAKVLDRTGLILEIFGRRARTREGSLQVELAHLSYQKSRLVRSWTHLERQRGGYGFLGGPGETQIETDRRIIEQRIARIETDLAKVKQTRRLHRDSRKRVPYPIVALVGYTNAGKSTLFNRMTSAEVLSADMLFATLDPTLRAMDMPHGTRVILSDTVGFISDLPTMLVAAFRATLEEVVEADVILHIRDISHQDSEAQSHDVAHVLEQLDIDPADHARMIEVWNKIDLLEEADQVRLSNLAERRPADQRPVLVSALTGQGLDQLFDLIEERLSKRRLIFDLDLDPADGAGLSWLYRHSEVMARETADNGRLQVTIRIDPAKAAVAYAKFGAQIKARLPS